MFAIVRNNKLNNFIETYHIPYNSTHRYWTGLLLLIRMIIYVITVSTISSNSSATPLAIIVMLSSLFFIKTLSVRVYKKWPLDALESALIINTIFMAAVALYAGDYATSTAATVTSTIIVAILMICVLLYHIKKTFIKRDFDIRNLYSKSKKKEPELAVHYVASVYSPGALDEHLLALNRHESILAVMGPPAESDYVAS